MNRQLRIFMIFLVCCNILLLAGVAGFVGHAISNSRRQRLGNDAIFEPSSNFTLYVGLNDKDVYYQIIPTEEARNLLNAVAMKHVDGFTVRSARGFWKDGKDKPSSENTLIYDFVDASDEQIAAIVAGMLSVMNQSAILVEKTEIQRVFVSH